MQKAYMESGRELLELYYKTSPGYKETTAKDMWEPEYNDIMEMTDVNGDGHVTFEEM